MEPLEPGADFASLSLVLFSVANEQIGRGIGTVESEPELTEDTIKHSGRDSDKCRPGFI